MVTTRWTRNGAGMLSTTALLMVLLAGMALPAPASAGEEEQERRVEVKKVIRLGGDGECEQGEECDGFVWIMKNDSDDPDGPQVHMMPLHGMLQRGWLGVQIVELSPELLDHYGVPSDGGLLVSKVEKESPAERAGLRVGDILAGIDGEPIDGSWGLRSAVASRRAGDVVRLEVWRDGRSLDIDATIEQRERGQFDMSQMFFPGHGGEFLFRMDPEALTDAQERLRDVLEDEEFRPKLHGQVLAEGDLRERLREVEKRLAELQERLQRALADEDDD